MPSGAKKRKAAKKKKEKQPSSNTTTGSTDNNNNQHQNNSGTDEVKSQDERDSDGAETGSPVSQDQNPFKNENEDAEKRESSPVQSFDVEYKSVDEVNLPDSNKREQGDEGVVEVINIVNSEQGSESKDLDVEHVKSSEDMGDGKDGSVGLNVDEASVSEEKSKEEENGLVLGTAPVDDSVKHVDFVSKEFTGTAEEKSTKKVNDSFSGETPSVDLGKHVESSSKEVICIQASTPVENSSVSVTTESTSKETGKNMLHNANGGVSSSLKTGDEVLPLSDENIQSSSTTGVSVLTDNGAGLSSAAPETETKAKDNVRESDNTERHDHQPLMASAPRAMQKTSWLSCCGLFDVVTGSSR